MMHRALFAVALATVGMLAQPSSASAAEEVVGNEGVFKMIVFKDGKKFNRCIMHQAQGKDVLRIASPTRNVYSLSIPTNGETLSSGMSIEIDRKPPIPMDITGQDKSRTWATLPPEAAVAIKNGRKTISVNLGYARYTWNLNNDMKGSFIVLDSCVEGYRNGA